MIRMQMQRFDELGWKQKLGIVLGVTVTLALAVGLIILATAVAIVLLPVVIVGALIARWRFNRMLNEARARAAEEEARRYADGPRVIDADFEIVNDDGPQRR